MFLWTLAVCRMVKPFMEAAGIEPAQDSPGRHREVRGL